MKIFKITSVILVTLVSLNSLAQKTDKTSRVQLIKSYALEANRLDLQTNTDSVDKAYELHTKVLKLDSKYVPSYCSKISIDYKRGNFKEALHTANYFVRSLPDFGDAWIYLGVVQTKLADSSAALVSFKKAINIYDKELAEIKDRSWQNSLKFKRAVTLNFLGFKEPVHTDSGTDKKGNTRSTSSYINDIETVEKYVSKFMTNHGIQFF